VTRADSSFLTTRWSLIARATSPDAPKARAALEDLCRAYWWPLYAYLRRRGIDGDRAADLVQGLFADVIEKGRLEHVDAERGRFRGWLLSAMKFHLGHELEREGAVKRGGGVHHVSIDSGVADRRWQLAAKGHMDPERTFERAWALSVLDAALVRLESRMEREGKTALFAQLKPFLAAEPDAASLRSIAAALGSTEGAVRVAAHRVRQAWRESIRAEVASTIDDVRDLDDEVRGLFAALGD
jgi:RNA polymerase sigma-70 factor (ECF subfamily)